MEVTTGCKGQLKIFSYRKCTAELTTVPVPVSAVAVESCRRSDLHLQLFALGGVGRHGVAVVRPQAALTLHLHGLSQLVGGVRAGAPAAQSGVLGGHKRGCEGDMKGT